MMFSDASSREAGALKPLLAECVELQPLRLLLACVVHRLHSDASSIFYDDMLSQDAKQVRLRPAAAANAQSFLTAIA